jgi:hypothetical protein
MNRNIDWQLVRAEHVTAACERIFAAGSTQKSATGLYVIFRDRHLPAKRVLRLAYCVAAGLPPDTKLKFSSGDGSLNLLRKLGFVADRHGNAEGT